jgi:putative ATP-dependent endonuclease of the OLD family
VKIRQVSWNNYRRLNDGYIDVHDHLVLVGPNDSGKSSILWAIHLCLGVPGAQLASSVRPRDLTVQEDPLILEVVLDSFTDDERAAFPDEIELGPPETLTVHLEAALDPDDSSAVKVERRFPFAGHDRGVSRSQFAAIGWDYVPATRSLLRELSGTSAGVARDLLLGLDLSEDAAAFDEARDSYRTALGGSSAIAAFRTTLAEALSAALPRTVGDEDVGVSSAADLLDSPLSGVTVTLRDGDDVAPLAEQSDGVRALSVLALIGLSQANARIVGIDEPETYLHITAQRAVAESLRVSGGQRIICTHSSAVVSQMDPLDVAAFGADRSVRQLSTGAHFAAFEVSARYWGHPMIEPLTARRVVLVEGVSDRIIVARVAELTGLELDRSGVAIFELDGANMFPTANRLFGEPGFDLALYGMVDSDAAEVWATELGVTRADLGTAGIVECVPDLERAYVDAFGVARVVAMLNASGAYTEQQVLNACTVPDIATLTPALLASFCRGRKTRAAIAIAYEMTPADAGALTPVTDLLDLVSP